MIRKGLKPRFKLGFGGNRGDQSVWRFRRSWVAISILAVMDIIFLIPAVATYMQLSGGWSGFDSLFNLVGTVFLGAWLLGWSTAPVIMTAILVLMLFGRETLRIRTGTVELSMGIPLIHLTAIYDVSKMRNLRLEAPVKKSGSS